MKKIFTNKLFICIAVCAAALCLCDVDLLAQNTVKTGQTFDGALQSVVSTFQSGLKTMFTILRMMMGISGAIMLVWNFYQRSKNDGQSNDKLLGWGIALLIGMGGLFAVQAIFFN